LADPTTRVPFAPPRFPNLRLRAAICYR